MFSTDDPVPNTSAFPQRRLLTIKETAEMLGCSEANVYSLLEAGDMPYVTIGRRKGYRIDLLDIDRFIAQRKQQPVAAPIKVPRPRLKHIQLT